MEAADTEMNMEMNLEVGWVDSRAGWPCHRARIMLSRWVGLGKWVGESESGLLGRLYFNIWRFEEVGIRKLIYAV